MFSNIHMISDFTAISMVGSKLQQTLLKCKLLLSTFLRNGNMVAIFYYEVIFLVYSCHKSFLQNNSVKLLRYSQIFKT